MQLLQLTKIARGLELLQACKCSGKGREPTPTKAMAKDIHGAQAEFTLLTTQTHSSRRQTLQHYKRITPTLCSSAANNGHVVQVHNTYDKVPELRMCVMQCWKYAGAVLTPMGIRK